MTDRKGNAMKIVQITDTHISHLGGTTNDNLLKIIEFINNDLLPDFIVHTGDVSVLSPDVPEDRATAKALLAGLDAPVRVLPGNHDVGETFENAWAGLHATSERVDAFVADFGADRWVEIVGDYAVLGFNSEILGADFVHAEEQWAWLETVPSLVGDRPTFVFCHKPFFAPIPGEQAHQMSIPVDLFARFQKAISGVTVVAWGSGHLHRYQLDRQGDAWAVSAPAVAFTGGDPTSLPGLHQLGVVEYVVEDGSVMPYFRTIPDLVEGGAMANPVVAQAFADLGEVFPSAESLLADGV